MARKMTQVRKFTVALEPAEEGGFLAKCLELPVATEGETRAEAIRNAKEAVEGYLDVRAEVLGESRAKRRRVDDSVGVT